MHVSLRVLAVFGVLVLDYFGLDILGLVPGYSDWAASQPFYLRGIIFNLVEIAVVLAAGALLLKSKLGESLRSLGLRGKVLKGLKPAVIAVIPLYAVFALTMPLPPSWTFGAILYLAVISPIAEEILFRGFMFGFLRRFGWNFWFAALVPALLFAAGHLRADFDLSQATGVFLITGIGALIFSWLYERWDNNLWVPIGFHVLMNLAWEVFEVGDSAFAGTLSTVMQVVTLGLAILLTLKWTSPATRKTTDRRTT